MEFCDEANQVQPEPEVRAIPAPIGAQRHHLVEQAVDHHGGQRGPAVAHGDPPDAAASGTALVRSGAGQFDDDRRTRIGKVHGVGDELVQRLRDRLGHPGATRGLGSQAQFENPRSNALR
jgi:hypothetical protein